MAPSIAPAGDPPVASRVIVRPLLEERGLVAVPVLERGDGRSSFQDGLRDLAVVEADVAPDGLLEVLAGADAVALQDILDAAVEPLHHSVRLRPHGRGG